MLLIVIVYVTVQIILTKTLILKTSKVVYLFINNACMAFSVAAGDEIEQIVKEEIVK